MHSSLNERLGLTLCCRAVTKISKCHIYVTARQGMDHFYYINTNEIPGELSRENLISSHLKITCYHHMWKYHRCYEYIVNRAFHTKKLLIKSEMLWYFTGVYIIDRTLHGCLEIRNFSSRVEKIFHCCLLFQKMITCKFLKISNSYDISGIIIWNESCFLWQYHFMVYSRNWPVVQWESNAPPPPPSEIADNSLLIHGLTLHNWRYLLWFKIEFFISDYFWRLFALIQQFLYICCPKKFVQHYFSISYPITHS